MNHLLRKTALVSCAVLMQMMGFARAEPTIDEQPTRCSFEHASFDVRIHSDGLKLDYQENALLMRFGEAGGFTWPPVVNFDEGRPSPRYFGHTDLPGPKE